MNVATYSRADTKYLVMVKLQAMDSDDDELEYQTHFMIGPFEYRDDAVQYIKEMHPNPGDAMILDLYPPSICESVVEQRLESGVSPEFDQRFAELGKSVVKLVMREHASENELEYANAQLEAARTGKVSKRKLKAAENALSKAAERFNKSQFHTDDVLCEMQSLNLLPVEYRH